MRTETGNHNRLATGPDEKSTAFVSLTAYDGWLGIDVPLKPTIVFDSDTLCHAFQPWEFRDDIFSMRIPHNHVTHPKRSPGRSISYPQSEISSNISVIKTREPAHIPRVNHGIDHSLCPFPVRNHALQQETHTDLVPYQYRTLSNRKPCHSGTPHKINFRTPWTR